ncbi:hypothetical protein T09_6555 [Trichinella sp. T9]|nr:hypothetical protein T09_6555 [Trichinella sp. T9]
MCNVPPGAAAGSASTSAPVRPPLLRPGSSGHAGWSPEADRGSRRRYLLNWAGRGDLLPRFGVCLSWTCN